MPRTNSFTFPFWLVLFPLLLGGCFHEFHGPVRVGIGVTPDFEPFILGRELGMIDENKIHLVEMHSVRAIVHALRNGNLEMAAMSLKDMLSLAAEGLDLRVVLVLRLPVKKPAGTGGNRRVADQAQAGHVGTGLSDPDDVVRVLVARGEIMERYADVLGCAIDGWFKTLDYIQAHRDDAYQRMAAHHGMNAEGMGRLMAGMKLPDREENDRLLASPDGELSVLMREGLRPMLASGRISVLPRAEHIVDGRWIGEGCP